MAYSASGVILSEAKEPERHFGSFASLRMTPLRTCYRLRASRRYAEGDIPVRRRNTYEK